MPFHESAQNITVEDGHILRAELGNGEGDWNEAEFDLNTCIGNNNGSFEWGGVDFSGSAEDITFELEGDGSVPVLRAQLHNLDGETVSADINLGERLHNNGGSFSFGEFLFLHNKGTLDSLKSRVMARAMERGSLIQVLPE